MIGWLIRSRDVKIIIELSIAPINRNVLWHWVWAVGMGAHFRASRAFQSRPPGYRTLYRLGSTRLRYSSTKGLVILHCDEALFSRTFTW